MLNGGKISGYKLDLDGAYNHYGAENNSTTDYLVRSAVSFGKNNESKNVSAALGGDYRINNCNTITHKFAFTYRIGNRIY